MSRNVIAALQVTSAILAVAAGHIFGEVAIAHHVPLWELAVPMVMAIVAGSLFGLTVGRRDHH